MFLNRWTIQVAKQGQNEEVSFASKEEALLYASSLLTPEPQGSRVSLILVDPSNTSTPVNEAARQ